VRLLSRFLIAIVVVVAVALAAVNRETVDIDLGAWVVAAPLYLLLIATFAAGLVVGWLSAWGGGAKHRRRAREEGRRATMLQDRVDAIERQRASSPARSDALVSPRIPPHMDDA
jgi:uncharacterized integral membrane protein